MSDIDLSDIIPAIDKKILVKELNKDRFVRKTNYGDNEIYIITHHDFAKCNVGNRQVERNYL